jgi:hypothetical protein
MTQGSAFRATLGSMMEIPLGYLHLHVKRRGEIKPLLPPENLVCLVDHFATSTLEGVRSRVGQMVIKSLALSSMAPA